MGPHRDIAIRLAWGVGTIALLGLAGMGVYVVVADRADAEAHHVLVAQAIVAPLVVALLLLCAALVARYGAGLRAARAAEVHRLREATLVDPLTGLRNHRAFHEDLLREVERAGRSGHPLSLALLDLAGLKRVNDELGLQAGDDRLRALARSLRATSRAGDPAYRLGGDEFGLILPGSRAWGGFRVVQRVQSALTVDTRGRQHVTGGIAEWGPSLSKDDLLARATLALADAEGSGRAAQVYSEGLAPAPTTPDPEAEQHHLKTLATALARAVDAKDSYTRSHCETVAETCALIGAELELDPERIKKLRLAGLLHDVGKIGIADAILQKPDRLTPDEYEIMKTHSGLGHGIVSAAELLDEAEWILHHHERPDGRGYPDALHVEDIPLESRIILVADAFEAMTSDRAYREGRPEAEALAELERHAGTQFDPVCVAALRCVLSQRTEPAAAQLAR
jgi:diguanylate cyclase (GGDEF)-like protein